MNCNQSKVDYEARKSTYPFSTFKINNENESQNNVGKIKKSGSENVYKINKQKNSKNINSLKCYYANARSIVKKFAELIALNEKENFDVIGITESWINCNKHLLSEFALPGYTVFNKDRSNRLGSTNKTKGGGVLLYLKESLNAVLLNNDVNEHTESVWVQIKQNRNTPINLGIIYRPPGQLTELDKDLFNQIDKYTKSKYAIIMGDFNYKNINWTTMESDKEGKLFVENIQNNFLHQKVEHPTRGKNILDLIICNDENLIENVYIGESLADSDHQSIRFNINVKIAIIENRTLVPNFRRANFEDLRLSLGRINWEEELRNKTVEEMWEKFESKLKKATHESVPYIEKRTKQATNKWVNHELKSLLIKKKHAYKVFKRTSAEDDKQRYHSLRRNVKKEIRKSKRAFEERIAENCKENPKEFFKYIRNKKCVKETVGPFKNLEGDIVQDKSLVADILNDAFTKVFTEEDKRNIPTPPRIYQGDNAGRLMEFTIYPADVEKALCKLNINKTPGPDGIHPRILKEAKIELIKPLTIIFNQTLREGKVPIEWKKANVTAIFKNGDKKDPSNYRPISLTSVICKLIETIIRDKIVNHLEDNSLILNSQHGFRRGRSCLTNLIEFFQKVINIHDDGDPVDIVYLDFKKAFDKVPHERLMAKLKAHGIGGEVANWVKDWLSNRTQRVTVDGAASKWRGVCSGVPQGSVLGPVLFILYINDLDLEIKSIISKFADDTKLAGKVTTIEDREQIKRDLIKLMEWADKWQMSFNVDKCKVMHIGSRNPEKEYTLLNGLLKQANEEKDLGVIITKDLKTTKQCLEAAKKANKILGLISRNIECKSQKTMLKLYNALVRPLLEYAVQFWSPNLAKNKDCLERVQRRATKLIPSLRNKSYEERLKECDLFSLDKRRHRGDMIQVFKILTNIDKVQEEMYFQRNDDIRTRNNGFKLRGALFKTNIAKNFFTNRVIEDWNKLPAGVVGSPSLQTFKTRLDKYYKTNNIL